MKSDACRADKTLPGEDLAQNLFAAYGRDAVAALRCVIADAEYLHKELSPPPAFSVTRQLGAGSHVFSGSEPIEHPTRIDLAKLASYLC